jgi:hypothetical protein
MADYFSRRFVKMRSKLLLAALACLLPSLALAIETEKVELGYDDVYDDTVTVTRDVSANMVFADQQLPLGVTLFELYNAVSFSTEAGLEAALTDTENVLTNNDAFIAFNGSIAMDPDPAGQGTVYLGDSGDSDIVTVAGAIDTASAVDLQIDPNSAGAGNLTLGQFGDGDDVTLAGGTLGTSQGNTNEEIKLGVTLAGRCEVHNANLTLETAGFQRLQFLGSDTTAFIQKFVNSSDSQLRVSNGGGGGAFVCDLLVDGDVEAGEGAATGVFRADGDLNICADCDAGGPGSGDIEFLSGTSSLAVLDSSGNFSVDKEILSESGDIVSGIDDLVRGKLDLYGNNGGNGGRDRLWNGAADDGVYEYFVREAKDGFMKMGTDLVDNLWKFYGGGDLELTAGDFLLAGEQIIFTSGTGSQIDITSASDTELIIFNSGSGVASLNVEDDLSVGGDEIAIVSEEGVLAFNGGAADFDGYIDVADTSESAFLVHNSDATAKCSFFVEGGFESGGLTRWAGTGSGVPFADMSVKNNAVTTTFGATSTYVQVTVFDTDGHNLDITPDHTNDHLTVNRDGFYYISCSVTLVGSGGSAQNIGLEIRKNNGTTVFNNIHQHRDLSGGASDTGFGPLTGVVQLNDGDTIELWCENTSNTNAIVFQNINLYAEMKGAF